MASSTSAQHFLRGKAIHIFFWMGVVTFYTLYFGREEANYSQSLLFVALLLPVTVGATYFLTRVLVPRYLLPKRYALFALYAIYTLIVSVHLELVVLIISFIYLAEYRMGAMNPAALDVFGLIVALYAVVFLAVAASLVQRWHRLREAHNRAERARLEAELQLKEAELSRLKAQINPHFLFNTLNNLYGLTLEDPESASEMVLRIAAMLDYVLYRSEKPYVPLEEEVDHLQSYFVLERLRYDGRVAMSFTADDLPKQNAYIAPLLLIPFVENSFKHGVSRKLGSSWVRASLSAADKKLHFKISNSTPEGSPGQPAEKGIGLKNVRQRLDLLYPYSPLLSRSGRPNQLLYEARGKDRGHYPAHQPHLPRACHGPAISF